MSTDTSTTTDPSAGASPATAGATAPDPELIEAFLGQVLQDAASAVSVLLTHLGDRLGLYRAMADGRPVTAEHLAAATGTDERLVREWLNNQAAGGYVRHDPARETFTLPAEHAIVLAAEDSPVFIQGLLDMVPAMSRATDAQLTAFRTGSGLGWDSQHPSLYPAVARCFEPGYRANLVSQWLAAVPGLTERLQRGARVADVGCGHGVTTRILATAFPASRVTGVDFHAPSIEVARAAAREQGLEGRVSFEVAEATALRGPYDLVLMCDCWHDTADPLGVARAVREALTVDGVVVLVEPFAHDHLVDNLNPLGRLSYGISTLVCTPCSLDDGGPGLGAQAGEARTRELFTAAGYSRFERVAETPLNIVYGAWR